MRAYLKLAGQLVFACEPHRFHTVPRIEHRRLSTFAFLVERDRQAGTQVTDSREASDNPDYLLTRDDHRYVLSEPFCRRMSILRQYASFSGPYHQHPTWMSNPRQKTTQPSALVAGLFTVLLRD